MNFRKGDRVKFLNDVGQGVVVRFQDEKIVIVLNDDGFEIPVLLSELLRVEGDYVFNNKEETTSGSKTESPNQGNNRPVEKDDLEEDGLNTDKEAKIFFALVPKNQNDVVNSDLDVFLINDSNFRILYSISKVENDFQSLFSYGNLEDNTKVILESIQREDLNHFEEINFQIIFFRKGNYYLLKPINKTWSVKPTRFFKESTFTENDFFHEKAFIYELTAEEFNLADLVSDSDIEKAKKEKARKEPQNNIRVAKRAKTKILKRLICIFRNWSTITRTYPMLKFWISK